MDATHYHHYLTTRDAAIANRLFGASASYSLTSAAQAREYSLSKVRRFLSVRQSALHISSFFVRKWGQVYINPEAIVIDLEWLPADLYKIVAVHNFRVEDCNPRLDECLAGVFLARRVGRLWEEAEDHPIECRSIEVLGYVDTLTRRIAPP